MKKNAIVWMLMGTLVFTGIIAGNKMTDIPGQGAAPIPAGEGGVVTFMPALSPYDPVAKDETGFIIMAPDDDLYFI